MESSHCNIESSSDHGNENGNEHGNESNGKHLSELPYPARDRFEQEMYESNVARSEVYDDDMRSLRMAMESD